MCGVKKFQDEPKSVIGEACWWRACSGERHKRQQSSDNGSSYIAGDLCEWLDDRGMQHTHARYH